MRFRGGFDTPTQPRPASLIFSTGIGRFDPVPYSPPASAANNRDSSGAALRLCMSLSGVDAKNIRARKLLYGASWFLSVASSTLAELF